MRLDFELSKPNRLFLPLPPFFAAINFAFIPPSQRLLYINTIQIGYNVFLSFLGNKSVDTEEKIVADASSPKN
jgi:Mpv17 / PMP22 family